MDLLLACKAVVLGIVEGLTEFLPVSSTAHLLVGERLLGFSDEHGVFTVVIQLGAILAVCLVCRARLASCWAGLTGDAAGRRLLWLLAIACLPAVILGLPADKLMDRFIFTESRTALMAAVVACTLCLGGLAILLIERRQREARFNDLDAIPARIALGIGLCQVLAAVAPGTSRSGATILGAMLMGVSRKAATELSFLLAIPVLAGASLLKLAKHPEALTQQTGPIAIGFVVSFAVALLVITWLLRYVGSHDLRPFGWYRLIAGLAVAALLAAGLLG